MADTAVKRLLIYAHFDPEGQINPYVQDSLRKYQEVCDRIVFASTSPVSESAKIELRGLGVDACFEFPNRGYDFGMWKQTLERESLEEWDELILTNSSVVGPLASLASLFIEMSADPCSFWGMTESLEFNKHLQSYFFVFKKEVMKSETFQGFWRSVELLENKLEIIRRYETGFTDVLAQQGYSYKALFDTKRICRLIEIQKPKGWNHFGKTIFNPTIAFAPELLKEGFPFIKLELLRKMPLDRPILPVLQACVSALDGLSYINELIIWEQVPKCPLCESEGPIVFHANRDRIRRHHRARYEIRKCSHPACGTLWLDPRFRESKVHLAYMNYHTPKDTSDVGPIQSWARPNNLLRGLIKLTGLQRRRDRFMTLQLPYGQGESLLELGCGNGDCLTALKKHGYNVQGQDIDPEAAANVFRRHGMEVIVGPIETSTLPEASLDIVVANHVIEHLYHPESMLRHCHKLLKHGGRLILVTPNAEGQGVRVFRRLCWWLDPPRHVTIYTQRALVRLLSDAGFEDIQTKGTSVHAELTCFHALRLLRENYLDISKDVTGHSFLAFGFQMLADVISLVWNRSGEEIWIRGLKKTESRK